MATFELTQAEADMLLQVEKRRIDAKRWDYPNHGGGITVPLVSHDRRDKFSLDLRRARINLSKNMYQTRGRQVVVLARLDLGGRVHRNPDGVKIGTPHLHLYREGYGDKWAVEPPQDAFADLSDSWQTLQDFLNYCNVVEPPFFRRSLFT